MLCFMNVSAAQLNIFRIPKESVHQFVIINVKKSMVLYRGRKSERERERERRVCACESNSLQANLSENKISH